MESIKAEWDIIKMIEDELNNRKKVEGFKHQLNCLKNLASAIQSMIQSKDVDYEDVHKATTILCKYLGILWQNVFLGNN